MSNTKKFLSSEAATGLAIFTSIQIVIGTSANLCEIIYFLSHRGRRMSTSDKMTLNLAISDFVALTTYLPWRTYLLALRERTDERRIYPSLYVVCIFQTGNAIICIALDRFTAVIWPLRYNMLITSNMCSTFIGTSWLSAIVLGILHYFSYKLEIHVDYEIFLASISFAQVIVLSLIYGVLLRIARRQTREIPTMTIMGERFQVGHSSLRKSVFTTFTITLLFYVVFLPYCIYRVYSSLDKGLTNHEKNTVWRWLSAFTFINSCCNPFVYFFGMKRNRKMFVKYFQLKFRRRSNENLAHNGNYVESGV